MKPNDTTTLSVLLLVVVLLFVLGQSCDDAATTTTTTTTTTDTVVVVAEQFKAPTAATPADVADKWQAQDAQLQAYIVQHVPAVLPHNGAAAFDEHLHGVQAVLRYWGAAPHVATAGLMHSIYGTQGFQGFALTLRERQSIIDLIGPEAEFLCFVFCMVDRYTVDQSVWAWNNEKDKNNNNNNNETNDDTNRTITLLARPELGRFPITLTVPQWMDFIELTLADWLEQVEGAASKVNEAYGWDVGQAYAYRRAAYAQMSTLLADQSSQERPSATVAPQMYQAVMATESSSSSSSSSRQLIQRRTPPLSSATAAAHEALRAAGEPSWSWQHDNDFVLAEMSEQETWAVAAAFSRASSLSSSSSSCDAT